jgi:hypothetical protein
MSEAERERQVSDLVRLLSDDGTGAAVDLDAIMARSAATIIGVDSGGGDDMSIAVVTLPTGETLPLWPGLVEAIRVASFRAVGAPTPDAWQQAFAVGLLAELFDRGLAVVPTGDTRTKTAVDSYVYALAVDRQHAVERVLHQVAGIFGPDPERIDLYAEIEACLAALTGHAAPAGAQRLGGVDERLRALRQLLLGIPADAPAGEVAT